MNWFQHDVDSTQDAKIKKLIIRHGAVGYAVYFHCLELIASDVSETNLTFKLEHDSEIIADNLKITGTSGKSGIEIVQEIMRTMIALNLFSESNGYVFCFKLIKRINLSQTSKASFREAITKRKLELSDYCNSQIPEDAGKIMTDHDDIMTHHEYQPTNQPTIPEREAARSRLPAYGKLKNVYLSDKEYRTISKDYGPWTRDDYIDRLSLWKPNAARRVKNDYATLLNWLRRDKIPIQSSENIAIMEGAGNEA